MNKNKKLAIAGVIATVIVLVASLVLYEYELLPTAISKILGIIYIVIAVLLLLYMIIATVKEWKSERKGKGFWNVTLGVFWDLVLDSFEWFPLVFGFVVVGGIFILKK